MIYPMLPESFLSEDQWRVLGEIVDAVISPTPDVCLAKDISIALGKQQPSKLPRFRYIVCKVVVHVNATDLRLLKAVLTLLGTPVASLPLTCTISSFESLSLQERWKALKGLQRAKTPAFRKLFKTMKLLGMLAFVYGTEQNPLLLGEEIPNPIIARLVNEPFWDIPIKTVPKAIDAGVAVINTDVVIIGSGSSGGVVARRLARSGYRVLVLEKAPKLSIAQVADDGFDRDEQMYEAGGRLLTRDSSMVVLGGSSLGGGAAVNWSCSLDTPPFIRREWAERGLDWACSTDYDRALEHVNEVMGVSKDFGAPHSFTNRVILEGSAKLGYSAAEAPQNTGKHHYNNRFYGFGHRYGERGGVVNWLYDAVEAGAEILSGAEVLRIRRKGKRATGCDVMLDQKTPVCINARKVIVAAGSLSTPGVLWRSGFKNKHIGRNLKLHPVTLVFGDYDEVVNKADDPIMTTVCTVADNLDGQYHGPKIEAVYHAPHLVSTFMPWRNGNDFFSLVARFKHMSALIVLTRDKDEGYLTPRSDNPLSVNVHYTTSKYDLNALHQGSIAGADLHYIQGARKVIMSNSIIPTFESTRPKERRSIWDSDYQRWRKAALAVENDVYSIGLGSAHQMSSCRISSKGPAHGPCDLYGRLYECKDVFVVDASVFPTASGVNPMNSIMAIAHVLAGFIEEDLGPVRAKI